MSSYKNYMDRIKLDDEQHEQLLRAVLAAEEEAAAKAAADAERSDSASVPGQEEGDGKIRRFPVKKFGWIASAAAVFVIAVSLWASQSDRKSSAELTATFAGVPEQQREEAADDRSFEYSQVITNVPEANMAPEVKQNETGAAPAYVIESPKEDMRDSSASLTADAEATALTAYSYSYVKTGKYLLLDQAIARMSDADEDPDADIALRYQERDFRYNTKTGFLYSEGKGITLSEEEQKEINSLIEESGVR